MHLHSNVNCTFTFMQTAKLQAAILTLLLFLMLRMSRFMHTSFNLFSDDLKSTLLREELTVKKINRIIDPFGTALLSHINS